MTDKLLLYAPPQHHVDVRYVPKVGEKWAEVLANSKFEIRSVQDLLQHYPRRHLDFSELRPIKETQAGEDVTIIGEITDLKVPPPTIKNRKLPIRAQLHDGSSKIWIAFFNQPWRAKQLRKGTMVAAKGKISVFRGQRQMTSPMIDVIRDPDEVVKIVPVYPATAEIHTAWLRRVIREALDKYSPVADPLPQQILQANRLLDRTAALRGFHFPDDMGQRSRARRRLVFDELFTLQCGLAYRKRRIESEAIGIAHKVEAELAGAFIEALPFRLTAAQKKAIAEIESDMGRQIPMHRLLQGEVGSGKTVVALYAALVAVQSGFQAAIMAPTEVLATQHYLTIAKLMDPLAGAGGDGAGQMGLFGGPQAVLLTGSVPAARRRDAMEKIASGAAGIVVGTHALIQEQVEFSNLGLAVVDEQHRFGVYQRLALKDKTQGQVTPDVLIMTATPIPRTLALTLYGDLDVSVLDELPAGRKPVKTEVVEPADRARAYDLVRAQVAGGRQAYVITPLVEESDKLQVRSAEQEAKRLAVEVFPDLRVGMMHGRLRPAEKDRVMDQFRSGEIDVLISTTVVEVGVDVPNATVMIIEDADRFGLSQLHQLRGRIGRGQHESTCLLMTSVLEDESERSDARARLQALASTTDGFELATRDLELRGAGTIMGVRQSGWSDLRLTNLVADVEILKAARDSAFGLLETDPQLDHHPLIRLEMEGRFADRLDWLFNS